MDRTKPVVPLKLPGLRGTPLLQYASPEMLSRLQERARQRRVARRGVLWAPEDVVTSVFWVRTGVVSERATFDGRDFVFGLFGKGEVVGEGPAVEALAQGQGATYATAAEAHEEATIYELSLERLDEALRHDSGLAMGFAAVLARRKRLVEVRLGALLVRSAPARMAGALLELASVYGVRDSRGTIINVRLTHRDLAGLVGASRETASVALLEWRRLGLVAVEDKRVVLLDLPRLEALARDERAAPSSG